MPRIFRKHNKENKYLISRILPLKPFVAFNLFGLVIVRKENLKWYDTALQNHEKIHTIQMIETLFVGFYLWYLSEWLIRSLIYCVKWIYYKFFKRFLCKLFRCSANSNASANANVNANADTNALKSPYRQLLFEREAYNNQEDAEYCKRRKPFQYRWLRKCTSLRSFSS